MRALPKIPCETHGTPALPEQARIAWELYQRWQPLFLQTHSPAEMGLKLCQEAGFEAEDRIDAAITILQIHAEVLDIVAQKKP